MLDILARHGVRFLPVSSYGRSGSTYFMALLAACGVQVAGKLPFEDRAVQVGFLAWLARGVGSPQGGGGLAQYFGTEYFSPLLRDSADDADRLARLDGYIAEIVGKGGLLAEKLIGMELARLMRAIDTQGLIRPIYLLRDPRDIFISVKAFNAKRGFTSFGDAGDDARMFRIICDFQKGQLIEQQRGGGLVLHYEDLVGRREQAMVGLLSYIGRTGITGDMLAAIRALVPVAGEAVRGHMTSATAQQSIRRWEAPEGAPYRAMFTEAAEAINASGYAA
jgi:hypothetical protein